jgi:hypothetical protein
MNTESELTAVRGTTSLRGRSRLSGSVLVVGILLVAPLLQNLSTAGSQDSLEARSQAALNVMFRATIADPGALAQRVSIADMKRQSASIPGVLSQFFADPALSRLTDDLQQAMANEMLTGLRDVDGGAKDFKLISATTDSKQADVKFRALVWIASEPVTADAPPASAPEGWWDYDFTFELTGAGWRVTNWSTDPEPGSGP